MKKALIFVSILLGFAGAGCTGGQKQDVTAGDAKEYTFFGMFNNMIYNENWQIFQKAKELTGVSLKGTISQNATDEQEAYNLMVASGDLPDIIRFKKSKDAHTLGEEGGLIPLEKLIDEHAPNIKKFFAENPRLKKEAVSIDGHIYNIPYYTDVAKNRAGAVYFIRKDWLDKLGLPEPKTMEDFYNTLVAFRTKDPNGNDKKDEVPFFNRINDISHALRVLLDIFQIRYGWYLTDKEVVYTPSTEKYKAAIKELSKWYKEGLIDSEYFTRDLHTVREYFFGNNLGGVTFDWGSTGTYMDTFKNQIPGLELKVILPPEINGISKTTFPRDISLGGWGISHKAKDPIGIIKYFDFWFTPEGRRLWNFGIEGIHYTLVDGQPIFTDYVVKNPDKINPLQVLYAAGAQWVIGGRQDYDYEKQWAHPIVAEGYQLYADKKVVEDIIFPASLKYSAQDTKEFGRIDAQLQNYANEMAQKWIMGASDIDKDWDSYIKRLKDSGLDRALELQKTAVAKFNQL